jgi:branched-chain amino acid transport system permease protein
VVFIAANEYFVANFGDTELNIVAMGALLVAVLMFFPEGIVGTLKNNNRLPRFLDWD